MPCSTGRRSGDILFRSVGADDASFADDESSMGDSRVSLSMSDTNALQEGLLSLDHRNSIEAFDLEIPKLRYNWTTRFLGSFKKQGRKNPQRLIQPKGLQRWSWNTSPRRCRASKYLLYAFAVYIMILLVSLHLSRVLSPIQCSLTHDIAV